MDVEMNLARLRLITDTGYYSNAMFVLDWTFLCRPASRPAPTSCIRIATEESPSVKPQNCHLLTWWRHFNWRHDILITRDPQQHFAPGIASYEGLCQWLIHYTDGCIQYGSCIGSRLCSSRNYL